MLSTCKLMGQRVTSAVSIAGLVALMFLAAMTLIDGLMRAFLNHPLDGVRDVGGLAIAIGVSCCFPVSLMERSHITVRFMASVFGARIGRWCDLLASVLTGLVFLCMAWKFTGYAIDLLETSEMTLILHIPVAPFWFCVAAALWLSTLAQLVVIADDVARLTGASARAAAAPDESEEQARPIEHQPMMDHKPLGEP